MATARSAVGGWEVIDLRHIRPEDLAPVFQEQRERWRLEFHWDLSASHEILSRFLSSRGLYGYGLVWNGVPVGFSYFISEEHKALIGDLYMRKEWYDEQAERMLFEQTLRAATRYPGVRRMEGQLLALRSDPAQLEVFSRGLRVFPRLLMVREKLDPPRAGGPLRVGGTVLRPWSDYLIEQVAELIAACYRGHIDSSINDQYQSYLGARRFLFNTTRHPGCGEFLKQASIIASGSERICGTCLGTRVDEETGHITQLCVAPEERRRGLARALLRRSMAGFAARGCRKVSLTVTASNRGAIELYESEGFQIRHRFPAFVWEAG